MINKVQAQIFCSEPIELIENYQEAANDKTQVWHCHHVWETMLDYSKQELIDMNEYYGIPACNLVFLTREEHTRLHHKGKKITEEHRKKISESNKGKKYSEESRKKISESKKGKKLSKKHCEKISESKKGEKNPNFGKHLSEETRKKLSGKQRNNIKKSKAILQFTKNGEFVAEYPSMKECERQTGINHILVSRVASGQRNQTHGYIFKYK